MSAGPRTSYTYDSAGLRVRKIQSWGVGGTQIFVYDQNQKLLGEYDANGNVLREYLWLNDMPIAVLTADMGTVQALPVHTDHLNTPRAVMDLDGILRWSWFNSMDVFGKDYASSDPLNLGGSVTMNLRFPGQVYDGESGMHYNVHRDYVPSLGRYAQSDPIGLQGGINTYSYVESNPLSFTDPLGLAPGDKDFGIKDPDFWKWWEREKYRGAWFTDNEPGFNPKKPFDIPNQNCADAVKAEYDAQKGSEKGNARPGKDRGKPRPRGGGRGWE